jgi:hypothetical protein
MANVIASQKIARTAAFDLSILLFLLLRASIFGFHFTIDAEPQLTLSDSALRRDAAQGRQKNARKIFMPKAAENTNPWKESNRTVTSTGKSTTFWQGATAGVPSGTDRGLSQLGDATGYEMAFISAESGEGAESVEALVLLSA